MNLPSRLDACRRLAETIAGSLLAVAAAPLGAQAMLVLPPSHAAVEGSTATNVPFGRSIPMRLQVAYDGASLGGPVVLTGVAFRLDGASGTVAKTVDLELHASTLRWGILGIQASFAQNRGPDEVVVLARQPVTLAASGGPSPAPFALQVPFDQPFAYDPSGGALLLELIVHAQPPGLLPLDATGLCVSPQQEFGPPGCGIDVTIATLQVMWGRPVFMQISGAPARGMTALVLGSIEAGPWAGMMLPLDLGPFGAPGCALTTSMLLVSSAAANATGIATFSLNVPALPALRGQWLRLQGLAVDPAANPLGIVTSQGRKAQICGWEAVSRIWSTSLTATSGVREIGIAPVVELHVQ